MTRDEVIAKARAARPDLTDDQLGKLADAYLAKNGGAVEVKTETVKVSKPAAKAKEPTPAEVAARARTLKFKDEERAPAMVMEETVIRPPMPRLSAEEHAKMMAAVPRPSPERPGGTFPMRPGEGAPPVATRFPTARSFVSTADAAVPMSAPPRAAQYVSGGGGRMSEYARTGPSDARAVLKGMRPDLAADIDAAGDDEVEELYTQYRAAR